MSPWIEDLLGRSGAWILFGIVLLNNMGLPVPGDTFLLAAGVLAEEGLLPFGTVVLTAGTACFLGGTAGYAAGRKWGRKVLRHLPFLRLTPERTRRVEKFLRHYGGPSIFLARFVALVHPVTGLFAGLGRMPLRSFLLYNLLGSFAYAAAYAALGYCFGESWDVLKAWMGRAAALSLAGLVLLAVGATFLRRRLEGFWKGPDRKG